MTNMTVLRKNLKRLKWPVADVRKSNFGFSICGTTLRFTCVRMKIVPKIDD